LARRGTAAAMEESHRARVHRLICLAERERTDGRAGLADSLQQWCWPGGGEDRAEPVAHGWVPSLLEVAVACTCADGCCTLCN
jgi:hypothetical protein